MASVMTSTDTHMECEGKDHKTGELGSYGSLYLLVIIFIISCNLCYSVYYAVIVKYVLKG